MFLNSPFSLPPSQLFGMRSLIRYGQENWPRLSRCCHAFCVCPLLLFDIISHFGSYLNDGVSECVLAGTVAS